ncbi:glycosyltransferase [Chryseobacterium sp. PS-8]|uniref:Glycosyltransferase n=1 Tax=Chryseobacterium indicum TaxID=2766954 RepID=A0ABS9C2V2_9FLAO|nr:glycosyltransferase [Chryseobacterium sp. PS-8]MCF2218024.1 glycosyltransferase [Chryseobacterium sp. PS-8]
MILIDALYINNSGGKVLLDYLIEELEKTDKEVFYLLDERIQKEKLQLKKNKVIYLKASLIKRRNFYKENKNKFSSILCFGNLPPNIKTSAKVYTYFHQLLFLDLPKEMSFISKKIYYIKTRFLNAFKKNTDYWLVQTELVKEKLSKKYAIPESNILVIPFYPPFTSEVKTNIRKEHQYIYVSNVSKHKNHLRLIEGFAKFYDKHKKGKLILTIPDDASEILNSINVKVNQGYPVENIGFVDRNSLCQLYTESEYHIFPSLTESFGLGLVEAIENGCKIIGADLPYTYAVCKPSLVFNPLEVDSITEALSLSLQKNTINSESKVKNEINTLISLLH